MRPVYANVVVLGLLVVLTSASGRAIAQELPAVGASELRDTVERYAADRAALRCRYDVPYAPARRERLRAFTVDWRDRLARLDFESLGQEGRIDYVLLDHELRYQLALLDRDERLFAQTAPWVPFAGTIVGLAEAHRRMEAVDPAAAARTLAALARQIDSTRRATADRWDAKDSTSESDGLTRVIARRAAGVLDELTETLEE